MKRMLLASVVLNILVVVFVLFVVQKLGGWNFLYYRMNNQGKAAHYDHRKSLYEVLVTQKGKTVFLGDSLTELCEWAELLQQDSIINRGISADQTDGVLSRLDGVLNLQPKRIFLMIGINDLLFHPPQRVLDNYKIIVERIQNHTSHIDLYVQSLLPINNEVRVVPIANAAVVAVNAGIEALAIEKGIPYINLHPYFTDANGQLAASLTSDGVHLNGKGYLLWKQQLEPYFK